MLPAETFADVASFLAYYDLGGLKLASKQLSTVANQCADVIRLFDFADFEFDVGDSWVHVWRIESGYSSPVCQLQFTSATNLDEFISDAFRNCIVGCLALVSRDEHALRAICDVADKIVVAHTLSVDIKNFENVERVFEFVDSFRQVKVRATE